MTLRTRARRVRRRILAAFAARSTSEEPTELDRLRVAGTMSADEYAAARVRVLRS